MAAPARRLFRGQRLLPAIRTSRPANRSRGRLPSRARQARPRFGSVLLRTLAFSGETKRAFSPFGAVVRFRGSLPHGVVAIARRAHLPRLHQLSTSRLLARLGLDGRRQEASGRRTLQPSMSSRRLRSHRARLRIRWRPSTIWPGLCGFRIAHSIVLTLTSSPSAFAVRVASLCLLGLTTQPLDSADCGIIG